TRRNRTFPAFRAAALFAAAAAVCAARAADAAEGAAAESSVPERYRPILDRSPFGPPPPKAPTPEELEALRLQQEAQNAQGAQDADPYAIPPGLDKIKVTLLSRFRGVPAVGFADGEDNASYYLVEGQSFGGITCEKIDTARATVTLSRGGFKAELPIWINPASTNRGDVTAYGQPGGRPVDLSALPQKADWEVERDKSEARRKLDEIRERRRKEREEREAERKARQEELAALTPEQRERRMHEINLDIIMNGKGPPLPIDLDDEDVRVLKDAGFEIPPEEERGAPAGRRGPTGRRHRPPAAD
ncbi:MAG: hypothetical protein IJ678_08870, partial [Kiritimatiellae bacterium]|nr:hypothetical protein [Kiritimatiellia bacterium]